MVPLLTTSQKRRDQDSFPRCGQINSPTVLKVYSSLQIFNNLVKQFSLFLKNEPETVVTGSTGIQGPIDNIFKAFGAITVLRIHMKRYREENLEIVARVLAECDGQTHVFGLHFLLLTVFTACYTENERKGYFIPMHCIVTDGLAYNFYKLDKRSNPPFVRGCFSGDPLHLQEGLYIPDYSHRPTALPFMLQLRTACEVVFDVMLRGYIEGLRANSLDSVKWKRPNPNEWDQSLQSANLALEQFRKADVHRQNGDFDSADATADEALAELHKRYKFNTP